MRPVFHSLGHVFVVLTSAKSNGITNISVKLFLVYKIAYTSIYDIIMSPEHSRFASLITVKNRKLSTVPVNFDYSRVWQ